MSATLQAVLDAHAVTLPGRDRSASACSPSSPPSGRCSPASTASPGSASPRCCAPSRATRASRARACSSSTAARSSRRSAASSRRSGRSSGRRRPRWTSWPRASAAGASCCVLDGYEQARLLDHWLRRRLVPALPAGARLLVAGREEPTGWRRSFGELALFLRLGSLDPGGRGGGARPRRRDRRGRGARRPARAGPPARAPARRRRAGRAAGRGRAALRPVPPGARAAECAARSRPPARSAARPRPCSARCCPGREEAVEALRALPFVELRRDGLAIHDTIRAVTVALRSAADPAGRRRDRVAACAHLRAEARDLRPRGALARHRRHAVPDREPGDPRGLLPHRRRGLRGRARHARRPLGDRGDRRAARAARVARAPARLAAASRPERFRVARAAAGAVAAFLAMVERAEVPHALYREDPVTAAWREALRADPLEPGAGALFTRWAIAATPARPPRPRPPRSGSTSSATTSSCGRRCAASTSTARDLPALCPALEPLGFATVAVASERAIAAAISAPGSTDGWLARDRRAASWATPADDDAVDAERRELRLGEPPGRALPARVGPARLPAGAAGRPVRARGAGPRRLGSRLDGRVRERDRGGRLLAAAQARRARAAVQTVRGVGLPARRSLSAAQLLRGTVGFPRPADAPAGLAVQTPPDEGAGNLMMRFTSRVARGDGCARPDGVRRRHGRREAAPRTTSRRPPTSPTSTCRARCSPRRSIPGRPDTAITSGQGERHPRRAPAPRRGLLAASTSTATSAARRTRPTRPGSAGWATPASPRTACRASRRSRASPAPASTSCARSTSARASSCRAARCSTAGPTG